MVAVLVTRPMGASELLAAKLKCQGYAPMVEPLLAIIPAAGTMPYGNFQSVMITSASALDSIAADKVADVLALPAFCIGAQTAKKAEQFGFRKVFYSVGDGEKLAALINNILPEKNRPILHIAGRDIAGAAQDELRRAGFEVVPWVVYAAEPVADLTLATLECLKDEKLDAVLLFSARTAETFVNLLIRHKLEDCCHKLAAIGLSEAVTLPLKPLRWRELAHAHAPSEDAMVDCLKRICPLGTTS